MKLGSGYSSPTGEFEYRTRYSFIKNVINHNYETLAPRAIITLFGLEELTVYYYYCYH